MGSTKAALIVGGSGFVGTHLALRLRDRYKVFATFNSQRIRIPGVTFIPVNVANRNWIKRVIYTVRPEVVIYAAGSNQIPGGEAAQREAELVHTGGAGTVCNFSEIFQPKFVYISNSYTFDGNRGNYHETDTVLPGAPLGKAKVGGENFIRGKALNYVIVRSSPLIGRGNGSNLSFLDRLRIQLERGERIEIPDREIHSFGTVDGLVETVERVLESGLRNRTLHYGGLTKVTHLEFARRFAERFGYDPGLIAPKREASHRSSSDSAQLDFSLNSTLATQTLKIKPLLLEQCFDLIEEKLVRGT